jgi:hypothetical protein
LAKPPARLVRYYGDSRRLQLAMYKPVSAPPPSMLSRPTTVFHLMPQIPALDDNAGNRQLHQALLPDGSSVVLYPFVCVIYTNVFDE